MARNALRRYYVVGEKGLIEWDVRPNDENDILVITEARYEVYKDKGLYDSGSMTIEDKKVSFIFEAKEKGEFLIRGFVTVPPETKATEIIAQVEG